MINSTRTKQNKTGNRDCITVILSRIVITQIRSSDDTTTTLVFWKKSRKRVEQGNKIRDRTTFERIIRKGSFVPKMTYFEEKRSWCRPIDFKIFSAFFNTNCLSSNHESNRDHVKV